MNYSNPIVHTDDPQSSHEAAELMNDSGARETHADRVLATVKANPGRTAPQLAEILPYDVTETRRRLSDLKASKKVVNGAAVTCPLNRTLHSTWYACPQVVEVAA